VAALMISTNSGWKKKQNRDVVSKNERGWVLLNLKQKIQIETLSAA